MDKSKFAAFGDRLKSGGAQMSRKLSGKVKEFLQGQTMEEKLVNEATSDTLQEPNWSINLRICSLLNAEEFSVPEIMKAIKKKISGKNTISQKLALDILEACAMNCEKAFSAIASEKVLDEMVLMIENQQTQYNNKQKALELIKAWGESPDLGYLPVFQRTYLSLKEREMMSATALSQRSLNDLIGSSDDQMLQPTSGYPISSTNENSFNEIPFGYLHPMDLSDEEKRETLMVARNTIELFSSLLNTEAEQRSVEDELMENMVLKCKQSQALIQRTIECMPDDEGLLVEALGVNEELQKMISRFEEGKTVAETVDSSKTRNGSKCSSMVEANLTRSSS